jgi:GrpB-like predicted nucleotidyltransferase (UPF0157 family)
VKKYVFKSYLDLFPKLFAQEKARLTSLLHKAKVEHVGSTAVPNLGGKGIIDIAIAVERDEMKSARFKIESLGYKFRPLFSTEKRYYFNAFLPDPEEETRRYHIHLTYFDSPDWKGLIHFRDYLLCHPEAKEEYARIKQSAAESVGENGEEYRKLKEPFFRKVKDYFPL